MEIFRAMQDSQFTDWLLGSDSIWTYPLVLTLHTVGLAILVGASVVIDLRLLGVGRDVPPMKLDVLYARFIWPGFTLNAVTGVILFITQAADRVVDPIFYTKLSCIFTALWLGQVARRSLRLPEAAARTQQGRLRLVAVCSLILWSVGMVAGRLVAYFGK